MVAEEASVLRWTVDGAYDQVGVLGEQHCRDLCSGDFAGSLHDQLERLLGLELAEHQLGDLGGDLVPAPALLGVGVQPGVVDHDPGGNGECGDRTLVVLGEVGAAGLLGQVQIAEGVLAGPDRYAEEALHRRVVRREAVRPGMFGELVQADRFGVLDQQTQDAVPLGIRADRGDLLAR